MLRDHRGTRHTAYEEFVLLVEEESFASRRVMLDKGTVFSTAICYRFARLHCHEAALKP